MSLRYWLGLHKPVFNLSFFHISESASEAVRWQKFTSALIAYIKSLKGKLKVLQKHQKHSDTASLQQRKI